MLKTIQYLILFIAATLAPQLMRAQTSCTPSISVVQTSDIYHHEVDIAPPTGCVLWQADVAIDSKQYTLLFGKIAVSDLSPGWHTASWTINGGAKMSQQVYFPGNGKTWLLHCDGYAKRYHPKLNGIDDLTKEGLVITLPTPVMAYVTLQSWKVTLSVNGSAVSTFVLPGSTTVFSTGSIAPATYSISTVATFDVGGYPSLPTVDVPCDLPGVYDLPLPNVLSTDCGNTANFTVQGCSYNLNLTMPDWFANNTYLETASVHVTGPSGFDWLSIGFFDPTTISADLQGHAFQNNTSYAITWTMKANNGTITTCTKSITTPKTKLRVNCTTAQLHIIQSTMVQCGLTVQVTVPIDTSCDTPEGNWKKVILWQGNTMVWSQDHTHAGQIITYPGVLLGDTDYKYEFMTGDFDSPSYPNSISCYVYFHTPTIDVCCTDHEAPNWYQCDQPLSAVYTTCNNPVHTFIAQQAVSDCTPTAKLHFKTTLWLGSQLIKSDTTNGLQGLLLSANTYTAKFEATDAHGNTGTCIKSFSVISQIEPVNVNCPQATMTGVNECMNGLSIPYATISGGCGATITKETITIIDSLNNVAWTGQAVAGQNTIVPLNAGLYTVLTTIKDSNGTSHSCTSIKPVKVTAVAPFATVICGTATADCAGGITELAPTVKGHCGDDAFLACWSASLYTGGVKPAWSQCQNGNHPAIIPAGTVTQPGYYPLEVTATLLNGDSLTCSTSVYVSSINPCCLNKVAPVLSSNSCFCLSDTLESCEPVQVKFKLSKLEFVDDCDDVTDLSVTLVIKKDGIPIYSVTNSDVDVWLQPGNYTFEATATDLEGNISLPTVHTMTISCPNANNPSNSKITLSAVPNPAVNYITFKLQNVSTDENLQILTSAGQRIHSAMTSGGTATIDVLNLPEGWYFANIAGKGVTKGFAVVRR